MAGFGVGGLVFNVCLLLLALVGMYRLYRRRRAGSETESKEPELPKMKKRDFSLEQLREYDGVQNPRLLLAVNGKVFDVTKGKKFYGPGKEQHMNRGVYIHSCNTIFASIARETLHVVAKLLQNYSFVKQSINSVIMVCYNWREYFKGDAL
ncbi:hypothetical protein scyTo_0013187 [Scyliorhinus torazame]|uniref:Cytochrome b5 heme-binding domain-containing protein n=1 Tax=Scyliorhinus torazame TaxID=75743 RepID=A0A401NQY1_SCYTO|nr:hypothetical protein [Scyliorhinus torazame]